MVPETAEPVAENRPADYIRSLQTPSTLTPRLCRAAANASSQQGDVKKAHLSPACKMGYICDDLPQPARSKNKKEQDETTPYAAA